jgi:hypothetical protein
VTFIATASDLVDGAIPALCTPPSGSTFPIGNTSVNCHATDAAGNTGNGSFTVTVTAPPVASPPAASGPPAASAPPVTPTPSPPPPAHHTPPPAIAGVTAHAGDHRVILSWRLPTSPEIDHLQVDRTPDAGGVARTVYTGKGTSFVDTHLENGVKYRYVIFAVNGFGDHSPGIAVIVAPHQAVLVGPADGTRVASPPVLRWVATPNASYYNVQLYRDGKKVLSVWPGSSHYALGRQWSYGGRPYTLSPGLYRWYVWAGFGPHRGQRYSPLLGQSSFVVPA